MPRKGQAEFEIGDTKLRNRKRKLNELGNTLLLNFLLVLFLVRHWDTVSFIL